mmetsp:Transcript_19883/g.42389  ORF Transcript_19883/g.42389 Transcript_19883/m.42389 type:complete len:216 (-) Transcript_19883:172-819(-)
MASSAGWSFDHCCFQPSSLALSCASRAVISWVLFCKTVVAAVFASRTLRVSCNRRPFRSTSPLTFSRSAVPLLWLHLSSYNSSAILSTPRPRSFVTESLVLCKLARSACTSHSISPAVRCSSRTRPSVPSNCWCNRATWPLANSTPCWSISSFLTHLSTPSRTKASLLLVSLRPPRNSETSPLVASRAARLLDTPLSVRWRRSPNCAILQSRSCT